MSSKGGRTSEFEEPVSRPPKWFQPPLIRPNLGTIRKRQSLIPRSRVEHVLLHENKNQHNMLQAEMGHLRAEHLRQSRVTELHRRAFLVRQSSKQVHLWENGIDHVRILPELVVESHLPGSKRSSMESSQRRYSMAMRSACSKRGSVSALPTSSLKELGRSQSFHGFGVPNDASRSKNGTCQIIDLEETNADKKAKKYSNIQSPHPGPKSGRLPSKPRMAMNSVSVPAGVASPDSLYSDRSKTEPTLNLTKSFTTYGTKFRREVTIANPRSMRFRASDDPRFKRLKTTLVPPEKPIDAVLQLSPSGRKVVERHGNSLYDYNELKAILAHLNKTFPKRERAENAELPKKRHRDAAPATSNGYLPVYEAFVDDESLYNSPSLSGSSMIFTEAE